MRNCICEIRFQIRAIRDTLFQNPMSPAALLEEMCQLHWYVVFR